MNKRNLQILLNLSSVTGIGPGKIRNLITALGSPETVMNVSLQQLIGIPGIDKKTAFKIKNNEDSEFSYRQIELSEKYGIRIITFWDDDYPEQLRNIYDPPLYLYIKGQFSENDKISLAIVGMRMPSNYGKIITAQFSRELVQSGFTIISGLARGVDTIAHSQALRSGGRTIAVLGSGFDFLYPPENRDLAEQIAEQGVVISEYPMGTEPEAGNFPRRNRIISGLSLGVIITEAGIKSGALITAFQALEQNREVFAVPGPINSGKSTGTNQLIKEGAKLAQGSQDIIDELEMYLKDCVNGQKSTNKNLNKIEKEITEILQKEPLHIDQIAFKIKKSVPEVLSVMLTLELMGVVRQLSGKMFMRI